MGSTLSKNTRRFVYDKYGGRCAYCGSKIAFEDMQVDHKVECHLLMD